MNLSCLYTSIRIDNQFKKYKNHQQTILIFSPHKFMKIFEAKSKQQVENVIYPKMYLIHRQIQ